MTSSRRSLSPTADRDIALMSLLIALLGAVLGLAAALMAGVATATAVAGGPWQLPAFDTWVTTSISLLSHPTDPGANLGSPWTEALTGRAGLYWMVTTGIITGITAVLTVVGRVLWCHYGPVQPGHASRDDLRR